MKRLTGQRRGRTWVWIVAACGPALLVAGVPGGAAATARPGLARAFYLRLRANGDPDRTLAGSGAEPGRVLVVGKSRTYCRNECGPNPAIARFRE
jgi:hypothetical protein